MNTSVETNFSGDAFRRRVADHITQTFGTLLPQEEFERLVNAQIKAFFETTGPVEIRSVDIMKTTSWGTEKAGTKHMLSMTITPFQQMVWELVKTTMEKQLREYFDEHGESELNKYMEQWLQLQGFKDQQVSNVNQLALAMAGRLFADAFATSINNVRMDMASKFQVSGMPNIANFLLSNPIQGV